MNIQKYVQGISILGKVSELLKFVLKRMGLFFEEKIRKKNKEENVRFVRIICTKSFKKDKLKTMCVIKGFSKQTWASVRSQVTPLIYVYAFMKSKMTVS